MATALAPTRGQAPLIDRFFDTDPEEFRANVAQVFKDRQGILDEIIQVTAEAVETGRLSSWEGIQIVSWNASQLHGYSQLHDPHTVTMLQTLMGAAENRR